MSNAPKLRTRRPTGKPPWPVLLIAGVEKAGKSYGAALFSASDLIDRTIIVELGEGAADQYGAIDGARYEIAIHDGTYASILEQIEGAVAEPRTNGKPHAIVVDNVTELWDMLSDEAQLKANQRARAKAAEQRKAAPVGEAQITMDLWNVAKKKWRRVIDALRVHDGPVILLARLESVAVMDGNAPAKNGAREWKVRAEKNLPFECDAIVKMTAPQECYLTGVRSVVLQVPPGEQLPMPGFTIDGLLRRMGLDVEGATAPRSYTAPAPVADSDDEAAERPAQYQQGRGDDEWQTPAPAVAENRTAEPTANPDDVRHILNGMRQVRGITNNDALRAAIEAEVRDQVPDPFKLTVSQVARIRTTLETESRARQQTGPGPVGAPNNPEATERDQRMMNGLLNKAGYGKREAALTLISRILRTPVTTREGMSRADTQKVVAAVNRILETGEMPPEWQAPAPAGDPEVFNVLAGLVAEVRPDDEESFRAAQMEIEAEFARGAISEQQVSTLRVRLAEHAQAVAA